MRPLAFVLAGSIAANAALAFFLVRSKDSAVAGGTSFTQVSYRTSDGSVTGRDGRVAAGGDGKGGAGKFSFAGFEPKSLENLSVADLKVMVERLRAAGFPASFIRAFTAAEVRERHASELKALLDNQPDEPFWQRTNSIDSKLMRALRELSNKQYAEMKELLGTEAYANDENAYWRRRQYGNLSPEKLVQVQDIVRDYSELRSEIQSSANGVMLPEDREKIALLEKEQKADLAALLTPEEMENYELRSSSTASYLRSQLSAFKPTEQEFRALYSALSAAQAQYGSLSTGFITADQMTKTRDAVLASVQSQLSPDRLDELKLATDPKYQMTNRLVTRLGLPLTTSVDVANVQQDIMQKAMSVRRDTSLAADARAAQLNALSQEAAGKLTTLLTPRGYEAYKQYGGYWLQNLNPPVVRRTTTTAP